MPGARVVVATRSPRRVSRSLAVTAAVVFITAAAAAVTAATAAAANTAVAAAVAAVAVAAVTADCASTCASIHTPCGYHLCRLHRCLFRRDICSRHVPTQLEERGRPGRGGQHCHACGARGGRTCGCEPGRRIPPATVLADGDVDRPVPITSIVGGGTGGANGLACRGFGGRVVGPSKRGWQNRIRVGPRVEPSGGDWPRAAECVRIV